MGEKDELSVALVPWAEPDLPLLRRLMGELATTLFIGGPETAEQIEKRHRRYVDLPNTGTGRMFRIVVGPDKREAGSVGYWETTWQGGLVYETGWSVLPELQGRGIATRATALSIEAARTEHRRRWLHAFPSPANLASNAICAKLGFTLLGMCTVESPTTGTPNRAHNWRYDLNPVPDDVVDPT